MDIYEKYRTLQILISLEDDMLEKLQLIQDKIDLEDILGDNFEWELE